MTENFYYAPSVREYIRQDFERFGYKFDSLPCVDLDKNLILYESDLPHFLSTIDDLKTENSYIFVIDHHYAWHSHMTKLDNVTRDHKIIFLGTQHLAPIYQNIKCFSLGSSEDWCRHDFVKYLVDDWHETRRPMIEKKFLLLAAKSEMLSHRDRNLAIDKIKLSLGDELLPRLEKNQTELMNDLRHFAQWMQSKFGNQNLLGGFGNGLPRFDLYDKAEYEIVLETNYCSDTIHVSEKTWRPIASGMPAVFLLSGTNLNFLESIGYKLEPVSFYNNLRGVDKLEDAVDVFLHHRKELAPQTSKHNFRQFWRRKNMYRQQLPILKKVFGYSFMEDLKNKLKEI